MWIDWIHIIEFIYCRILGKTLRKCLRSKAIRIAIDSSECVNLRYSSKPPNVSTIRMNWIVSNAIFKSKLRNELIRGIANIVYQKLWAKIKSNNNWWTKCWILFVKLHTKICFAIETEPFTTKTEMVVAFLRCKRLSLTFNSYSRQKEWRLNMKCMHCFCSIWSKMPTQQNYKFDIEHNIQAQCHPILFNKQDRFNIKQKIEYRSEHASEAHVQTLQLRQMRIT